MKKLINLLLKKHTYSEIAAAAGYRTPQSIRNIAGGLATMPIFKQKELAKNLNVPLAKLRNAYISDIKKRY
jgi:hypothetical protein|tara:strand:- start:2091 stop:2303 length:213 start_codon:yes stop_codon:yes gene_type:complete